MTQARKSDRPSRSGRGLPAIVFACLLCLSYFVSLWLPALYFDRNQTNPSGDYYPGGALLLLGWLETFSMSTSGITWLANPLFAVGLLMLIMGHHLPAVGLQASSVALASLTFAIKKVLTDEAGNEHAVIGYGPGFWIWYLTLIASFVVSVVFYSQTLTTKSVTSR